MVEYGKVLFEGAIGETKASAISNPEEQLISLLDVLKGFGSNEELKFTLSKFVDYITLLLNCYGKLSGQQYSKNIRQKAMECVDSLNKHTNKAEVSSAKQSLNYIKLIVSK